MKAIDKDQKVILKNLKHDLMNPISTMIGFSELILEILINNKNHNLHRDVNNIKKSSNDILIITNQIFKEENYNNIKTLQEFITNQDFHYTLRTSLTNILGLCEIALDEILEINYLSSNDNEECLDSIKKINLSAKALLGQINEINNYSNMEEEELIEAYFTKQYLKSSSIINFDIEKNIQINIKSGTIVIIDDEKNNCQLIKKLLKHTNHTIFTKYDGKESINYIENNYKNIDLILLDLIMPNMNGIEILSHLKHNKYTYHIPVIMLSALDEIDAVVDCISLGADDFLFKPINRILLEARIKNSLEKKYFHDKEIKYQKKIKLEQKKSNDLLLNILPKTIADRLKKGETPLADKIDSATVLFADLKGFTQMSSKIPAKKLVIMLNNIFSEFDELLVKYNLEKIKTIGDNYMLAGGIPEPMEFHAEAVSDMALEMINSMSNINKNLNTKLEIRIGINSGPLSAGVIGKKKFSYDLWGDTVNVASRMESYGKDGFVHISKNTYKLIKDKYTIKKCDPIEIHGKGIMETYYIIKKIT